MRREAVLRNFKATYEESAIGRQEAMFASIRSPIRLLVIVPIAAVALGTGCAKQSAAPQNAATPASATPTPTAADNVSAMTAQQALTAARTALASSSTFHVKNVDNQNGVTTVADIVVSGSDFSGTVTTAGVPLEMVKVGDAIYLKGDTWWKMKAGSDLVKGKYGKISAPNEFYDVTVGMFGRKNYTSLLDDLLASSGEYAKDAVTVINGQPVVKLTAPSGTIYIATTGQPYPIRVESASVTFDFSDFDKAVEIKAPPTSDVLELRLK